jgi:hypothetical protein
MADGIEFIENSLVNKIDIETKKEFVLCVCQIVLADECNESSFFVIKDNLNG